MANQQWQVLDLDLYSSPAWVPGSLYIGGIGLALGYLGDPEKTAASFVTHPRTHERLYRTGDLGRWRSDFEIEFLGREDFQVKVNGFRVELGEIEQVLRSQEGVQEGVVQAVGELENRYLAAWVQMYSNESMATKQQLKMALQAKLPAYMVPNVIVFCDTLPVTSNGKLDRKALAIPDGEDSDSWAVKPTTRKPNGEYETALLALFHKFLHPGVGLTDSFFEAGGSSLRAMQMAAEVRRQFGVSLGIGDVVSAPSVLDLASKLDGSRSNELCSPYIALQGEGDLVPIFMVHTASGHVASYRSLIQHLPARQPLFGFEGTGLTGTCTPDVLVQQRATRYVQTARHLQGRMLKRSDVAYNLAGFSSGGVICYEMARQLIEAGETVARLLLIDTAAPENQAVPWQELITWFLDDLQLGYVADALDLSAQHLAESDAWEVMIKQLGRALLPSSIEKLMPIFGVFSSFISSTCAYSPSALSICIDLIRSDTQVLKKYAHQPGSSSEDFGWLPYTTVSVHWLKGTHHTLLGETTAHSIAALLSLPITIDEHPGPPESAMWSMSDPELARAQRDAEAQYDVEAPEIQEFNTEDLARLLSTFCTQSINADTPFAHAGLTSLQAVRIRNALQMAVGGRMALPVDLLLRCTSLRQLVTFFEKRLTSHYNAPHSAMLDARTSPSHKVMLSGASSKLPRGVDELSSLRKLGLSAYDTATELPFSRSSDSAEQSRYGCFVDDSELFDEKCFNISLLEAREIDPQQRNVLEQSYAALLGSGTSRHGLSGSLTGVVVAIWNTDFSVLLQNRAPKQSSYNMQNISISIASGRVSYVLGLHGPCTSVDTACSSSLVAMHLGISALQREECRHRCVATGVNLIFTASTVLVPGMTSVLGRCHSFDLRADGYTRAEACSSSILQEIDEKLSSPPPCTVAVQSDGRSASLTAPNGMAQAHLLDVVYKEAGVSADGLFVVEAHATGTPLGDPIETRAIAKALAPLLRFRCLVLNCMKANVAHSETSAGMTGLLALVLALWGEEGIPNAQLRALNPHVHEALGGKGGITVPVQCVKMQVAGCEQSVAQTAALVSSASPVQRRSSLFDVSSAKALRASISKVCTAAMQLSLISLGAELGYWQSLLASPATASMLAQRTGCSERYTREWCLAMAAGGILEYRSTISYFSVSQPVRSAMQDVDMEQLMLACDLSAVTGDRSSLLDHCRKDGKATDAAWNALLQPVASTMASLIPLPSLDLSDAPSIGIALKAVRHLHLVALGCELGYWQALCGSPMDSSDLAQAACCKPRPTNEWCNAMASLELLERKDVTRIFAVPQRIYPVLTSSEKLLAACNLSSIQNRSRLAVLYREGGGIPWGLLDPNISSCTCCCTSATYSAALVPSLPYEIRTKLESGAVLADVGCGQGAAACLLAERFPSAHVHGFDYHTPSIAAAVATARHLGLSNVKFEAKQSDNFALDESFDIVCFFDCFHDMSVATQAAKHVYRVLRPDGMVLLVEPMAAAHDDVAEQIKVPTAVGIAPIA